MRTVIFFFAVLCLGLQAPAQKRDKKLQRQMEELIRGFGGNIGVYVKNLKNGKTVAIDADSVFPTASMVKIPILVGIMDKLNRGELDYHQTLTYKDSLLYEGVDILGSFKSDEKIELSKVMMLMLTMSDNTASLWLQSLAGKGTRINEILDSLGFIHTRVNSRTPGRETARSVYGWGQTSPREMATVMEKISNGEIINPERSARMLRLLGRNYWDEQAVSQIPSDVFVASKNGAVDESRGEVMFVNGHGARYVFCVCTKNNKDKSWTENNEAWVLTRKLSKLVWERFQ
ncbi:serine hydrolase [Flavisolibacter nicotianae]|uniref:serine hydrolase n=1 Tax=Flavisolibacter nicotianae TaxID=2364882 RepID=UPI000EAFC42D|nr:serine hydrolase [Flavisolibacter nicotianae]